MCRILAEHGFVEVRRRGSHIVMQRRTQGSTRTVPVPDHSELRIGTSSRSSGSRSSPELCSSQSDVRARTRSCTTTVKSSEQRVRGIRSGDPDPGGDPILAVR